MSEHICPTENLLLVLFVAMLVSCFATNAVLCKVYMTSVSTSLYQFQVLVVHLPLFIEKRSFFLKSLIWRITTAFFLISLTLKLLAAPKQLPLNSLMIFCWLPVCTIALLLIPLDLSASFDTADCSILLDKKWVDTANAQPIWFHFLELMSGL